MKTNFLQEKSYSFAVDIVKITYEIQKKTETFCIKQSTFKKWNFNWSTSQGMKICRKYGRFYT